VSAVSFVIGVLAQSVATYGGARVAFQLQGLSWFLVAIALLAVFLLSRKKSGQAIKTFRQSPLSVGPQYDFAGNLDPYQSNIDHE